MIHEFCRKLNFPYEAETALVDAYEKIKSDKTALRDMLGAEENYIMADDESYKDILKNTADRLDINRYTLNMVFVITALKPLRYMYWAREYPDKLYWDTVKDTSYKLEECHKLYGVWGNFTLEWYRLMCKCCLFTLGRLQYEPISSPLDYKDIVKKGDKIINVHIPSGSPLRTEEVYDSFDKAYEFFGAEGDIIFTCHSWLLYPPHYEVFPEGSNLRAFYELWDVVRQEESEEDFWRVFYKEPNISLSEIIPKTSLEKRMLDHLKSGGSMGAGQAFIVYRPGKKLR